LNINFTLPALVLGLLLVGCSNDNTVGTPVDTLVEKEGIENRGTESSQTDSNWWDELPLPGWAEYEVVPTGHPWFEVHRIEDGILAIYEPGQFEQVISFLIIGEQRALLFDTGLGMGDIAAVVAELTDLPLTVLNSHGHYDHTGGNYQFDGVLARNLPFTKNKSKGSPHAAVAEFAGKDWIWKQHPPGFDAATYQIKPYRLNGWIEEGQFIDLGGVSLEIVYAPGHAPDGIVLIDHQRRLMFTGDVFYPAPLYSHLQGSNFADYAATAARLAQWAPKVDRLLTSHNTPVSTSNNLLKMDAAFQSIIDERASYETSDGAREYRFDGFSILTADPP
jgi:glyoxylase-like metal-dependent hydrolase (beta-lactamase superfamily II)